MRRYGEPVNPAMRYTPRPGAYAILLRKGDVLLTHQAEPVPEVQLPGGGIDPGEQVLPALHREILEETGWIAGRLRRLTAYRRFTYMPEYDLWAEKLCTVYSASPGRRHGPPSEAGHTAVRMPAHQALQHLAKDRDRLYLAQAIGIPARAESRFRFASSNSKRTADTSSGNSVSWA